MANVPKSEISIPKGSAWEMVKAADNPTARYEAGLYAVEAVPVPGFAFPVPRFFFDLPWLDDTDEIVTGILAQIASADDLAEATAPHELRDLETLAGEPVTVLGLAARMSDLEDAKWGAYLMLTVSVDGGPPETVTTGAAQVCVIMWRLFCEGALPVKGVVTKLGTAKKGRSQPLGFYVEGEL